MKYSNEPMLDMFIFETTQLIEQLETAILSSEKSNCYTQAAINEIFRIMHTIKGCSAMMLLDDISSLAHAIEDLFYFLREEKPQNVDCCTLSDLVLEGVDFVKVEMEKIKNGDAADGKAYSLIDNIKAFLAVLKHSNTSGAPADTKEHNSEKWHKNCVSREAAPPSAAINFFKAVIFFEEGCEMENIRAFEVVHNLKGIADEVYHIPENITDNSKSSEIIQREGFKLYITTHYPYEQLYELLMRTVLLKKLELTEAESRDDIPALSQAAHEMCARVSEDGSPGKGGNGQREADYAEAQHVSIHNSIISVNVNKLDRLMDRIGEMVIAEAMVVQNPDLKGMQMDNFQKAAWQLNKIVGEIQDMVMSIRMVPLADTFNKMHRIVRDMCRKLDKEVELEITGEETEVDKNIIEHISDPLMHLIRNSIDHGIEPPEERKAAGKPHSGRIALEARNAGSDVLIIVKDDGRGLNRERILTKARENDLLLKPEDDMSDREIFSLIFLAGFSTKDGVSEYSGRGVGLDVVTKNIEKVGGSVQVDSVMGRGTSITMKIPLTLAIIDGMNIQVGSARYTIPIISIMQSFRPAENDIITDPDGNEMVMLRGCCYPVLRLHEHFNVRTEITEFTKGIFIMVESEHKVLCIFADELLGQQQVVIKALPAYIRSSGKTRGLAGCTLLGDGSISLIVDIAGLAGLSEPG
ncbi:two-component system chemotaxis sensor kinase CheA [Anaerobacterium chartisolvens]|uniref:Chemotaxis protein CheA n=1 Tax=Anaerobacterium chartisolvens TaxID=1297424 RepID=A0A369BFH3_9FIRM|nr:chemotaxis protein CheA [Anaerobacterium chartisolvens]RCX20161.1 two-component system chemotaxis sensor kinase CheA [Anaerobacterium chartisolvens]